MDYKLFMLDFDKNANQDGTADRDPRGHELLECVYDKKCWFIISSYNFQEMPHSDELINDELQKSISKFSWFFHQPANRDQIEHLFRFAIACLSKFVQENFTGPPLGSDFRRFYEEMVPRNIDVEGSLRANSEVQNVNARYEGLLVVAAMLFMELQNVYEYRLVARWWQWRTIMVHQQILDELSPTLLVIAQSLAKEIVTIAAFDNESAMCPDLAAAASKTVKLKWAKLMTMTDGNSPDADQITVSLPRHYHAKLHVEMAQLYTIYRQVASAAAHIKCAQVLLGVDFELAGRMGKRTKYQHRDIAQLTITLQLRQVDGLDRPEVAKLTSLIQNLELKDDVRLDTIKFADSGAESDEPALPNIEQQLIFAIIKHVIISTPKDDLYYEKLQPFVQLLLANNNVWSVRTAALLLRCSLETDHKRTVERSLQQCETVLAGIRADRVDALYRLGAVYAVGMEPLWCVKVMYARVMVSLGLVKAALALYSELQQWEEVIYCYTYLEMRHKAAEVIKTQLEKEPSDKLYCWLGDCLDDTTYYEAAIELSKGRSHRAQRHWGNYHYQRGAYEASIPHFEKSVSINPLQPLVWLRLGYAALDTKRWQTAATAYRRYTNLEPDGFESWNNLAQAYIQIGNKQSAHMALREAIRCNYSNWHVWENFLVVSADLEKYSDVVRAYMQLLDLKERYLNKEVILALVNGIKAKTEKSDEAESELAHKLLLKQTQELLGRLTTVFPNEGMIWETYATFAPTCTVRLNRLQRAFKSYTMNESWTQSVDKSKSVLTICQNMGDILLNPNLSSTDDDVTFRRNIQNYKMMLNRVIATVKQAFALSEMKENLQEVVRQLEAIVIDKTSLPMVRQ